MARKKMYKKGGTTSKKMGGKRKQMGGKRHLAHLAHLQVDLQPLS